MDQSPDWVSEMGILTRRRVLVVVTALAIAATPVLGEDRLQLVLPLGAAVALLADEPAETVPCRPAAVVTSRTTGSGSGQQLDLLPARTFEPTGRVFDSPWAR